MTTMVETKKKKRTPWVAPNEVDFHSRMLRSIKGKRYEVYAVSRILHLLDDPEIEIVTQQPVRIGKKLALLDLYLPQFKIGIEVDELHHFTEGSQEADKVREQAIIRVATKDIWRVRVEEAASLTTLKHEVDSTIERIQGLKAEAIDAGTFTPFIYGNRYSPQHWREVGKVTTGDDIQMHSMVDVCALFGKTVGHWQRGVLPLTDTLQVWMPHLTQEGLSARTDWKNTLSRDELTIVEEQLTDGEYLYDAKVRSVVFAKFKDPVLLTQFYRFLGVFKIVEVDVADGADSKRRVTYARVAAEIDLTAYP